MLEWILAFDDVFYHVQSHLVPTFTQSPKLLELIRIKPYDYSGCHLYLILRMVDGMK
jgi:hypothetical protein